MQTDVWRLCFPMLANISDEGTSCDRFSTPGLFTQLPPGPSGPTNTVWSPQGPPGDEQLSTRHSGVASYSTTLPHSQATSTFNVMMARYLPAAAGMGPPRAQCCTYRRWRDLHPIGSAAPVDPSSSEVRACCWIIALSSSSFEAPRLNADATVRSLLPYPVHAPDMQTQWTASGTPAWLRAHSSPEAPSPARPRSPQRPTRWP